MLQQNQSPKEKTGELDNRGSHFYLALYWAEALAEQNQDSHLKALFAKIAAALTENEASIAEDFAAVQGKAVDMGGYYLPDDTKMLTIMRPSETFNQILTQLG